VIGKTLGQYRVLSKLGEGGMGEVYRAHDPRLGRDIALKVLPESMARDAEGLARFTREARVLAALNHPHIVTIFSTEDSEGVRFLTMELVEGRTLDQVIPAGGVSMAKFFDVATALADALAAAHQRQITHRDLKPGNVMVADDGRVKVLDFGLSRADDARLESLEEDATRLNLTESGTILGTRPYMSPEQIEARPLDGRSDLFSLGIVLYEMATGRRPFNGESSASLMSSIMKDRPRPLSELRPDLSDGVARIVTRCLEKNPRDRFQSGHEILGELRSERRAWESGASAGRQRPSSGSSPAARPAAGGNLRVAVLPFSDLSAARDQEWFCDGIAEELLTTLSQIKGLTVAARASAFSFRGRGDDLAAIGEKLHVTTVLDGSVRRAGDRLRITVRLSDVANGYQIWSERYDRDVSDVFDVQDEIAKTVAQRLRVGLAGDAAPRVVRHTENQEAYDLYLRGRHLWYARSKGSLLRARQLFEQAIEKDPNYVLPYVGLAELFCIQALYGFEREDVAESRARAALSRALAINDQVAEAHRGLGFSHLFFSWDMKAGLAAFERSVELDPTSGLAHVWLAWPHLPGREAAAIAAVRRAQALDPLNAYVHSLAGSIYGRYDLADEAVRAFERAFEIDPNSLVGLYLAGGVYSQLGRHDDALRVFARAVDLTDRAPFYVSYEAWAQARAGRIAQARAGLAELETRAAAEYIQPLFLAIVHAALGEMDQAFARLEAAVERRNAWIGSPRMPLFDNFRPDPRFAAHLRRIGQPDEPSFGAGE
jgi:serine/threonine protein kinase/tetratricopeptide (TPR) repeat protein